MMFKWAKIKKEVERARKKIESNNKENFQATIQLERLFVRHIYCVMKPGQRRLTLAIGYYEDVVWNI